MTFRITYRNFNSIDDYLDTFPTVSEAIAFLKQVNARSSETGEEILDIQPVND